MFLCCNLFAVGFGLLVPVKWLVGKIVSEMTYSVLSGMLIHVVTDYLLVGLMAQESEMNSVNPLYTSWSKLMLFEGFSHHTGLTHHL